MGVFEAIGADQHEEVLFGCDPESGLETIIAIHSTALGPALGGTRFFSYENEDAALRDVLNLSRAMSYKAAAAGLDLGGGKAVIIGDPGQIKSERLLRAYGQMVESLGGRYVTAEDVGTTTADLEIVARETAWVTGLPESSGGSGNSAPATARGVLGAMKAVALRIWGSDDLSGRMVAVQGVGKVGSDLVARLTKAGAATIVADVYEPALDAVRREHGSEVVTNEAIFDVECDLFAPCALGGALSETTIPRLRCAGVVGSANNQLATDEDAIRLADHDIVYAPDFIANAGGVINIAEEIGGYDWKRAAGAVDRIFDTLCRVFETADAERTDPQAAAMELAKRRIGDVGSMRRWTPSPIGTR
ncbi:MAG: Glu/Leu/Phe/Val dehydrogenase [Acidimicrobiia bacterium]